MQIENYLEYTLLKSNTDLNAIKSLCEEAKQYHLFGVCLPPFYVLDAKRILEDSKQKIVTVVGFPFGYNTISSKVEETKRAVDDGADEIDMVVNISAVKDGKWTHVRNDIDSVTRAAHLKGCQLKLIIEASYLNDEEIKRLCDLAIDLGVNFIKTSTGVIAPGASVEMVKKINQILIGSNIQIKASGAVNNKDFAIELLNAGATRIGTSTAIQIIKS